METYKFVKMPKGAIGALPRDPALLKAVIGAAREAFGPQISGLTKVSESAAILQAVGDPTIYAVALTKDQAVRLGWMKL